MKNTQTTTPMAKSFPHPLRTLVGGDLQTTRDTCRRLMTIVESAAETDEKAHSASQNDPIEYFQQPVKGSRLVVPMILAGDIITTTLILLWLFRWR